MKVNIILLLLCIWFLPMQSQYTNIPDPIFEQELITQGIDTNQVIDHKVLTSQINTLTSLAIDVSYIHSYIGLEAFINLEYLQLGGYGLFNTLNLSSLTNLKHFLLAACFVTNLDFSQNTNIERIEVANDYTNSINIDNCLQLTKLVIVCPQITSINLSNNINLKDFGSYSTQITNFNISQNNLLEKLTIRQNIQPPNSIINIDLTNNINLNYIFIQGGIISSINLQNNTLLDYLLLYNIGLSSINLTNNVLIKTLNLNFNQISILDVSNLPLLESLSCSGNTINTLNVNNNQNLNYLNCYNNDMHVLIVQNGSNQLLNGTRILNGFTNPRFGADYNPNLTCILVDDIANATQNWVSKDANSTYVTSQAECNNLNNEQFVVNKELTMYPNPAVDFVNFSNYEIIKNIKIYDISGNILLRKKLEFNQLNISELNRGIYFVSITDENKKVTTLKLVKK